MISYRFLRPCEPPHHHEVPVSLWQMAVLQELR